MNPLKTGAFCVLLSLCTIGSFAQKAAAPVNEPDYNKPKLFADLPQRLPVSIALLESLFGLPAGHVISIPFTAKMAYQGTIIATSGADDETVKTVTIKSNNRVGSLFTFTRLRKADGKTTYMGRIISQKHGDAYELIRESNGYFLEKRNLYDLFNE